MLSEVDKETHVDEILAFFLFFELCKAVNRVDWNFYKSLLSFVHFFEAHLESRFDQGMLIMYLIEFLEQNGQAILVFAAHHRCKHLGVDNDIRSRLQVCRAALCWLFIVRQFLWPLDNFTFFLFCLLVVLLVSNVFHYAGENMDLIHQHHLLLVKVAHHVWQGIWHSYRVISSHRIANEVGLINTHHFIVRITCSYLCATISHLLAVHYFQKSNLLLNYKLRYKTHFSSWVYFLNFLIRSN